MLSGIMLSSPCGPQSTLQSAVPRQSSTSSQPVWELAASEQWGRSEVSGCGLLCLGGRRAVVMYTLGTFAYSKSRF